jgi:hypothetical protein
MFNLRNKYGMNDIPVVYTVFCANKTTPVLRQRVVARLHILFAYHEQWWN